MESRPQPPAPRVVLNSTTALPTDTQQLGDPLTLHARLPGYRRTPLLVVPGLADRLGIRSVLVKIESDRLGLPAFKMLGASWAAYRAVMRHIGLESFEWNTIEDLTELIAPFLPLALATATDGNHGRAVARMAHLLGLTARICVPEGTTDSRIKAIESEGASCTVVAGTYDDAVAVAAQCADDSTLVVSDTSWPGYQDVPRWVIDGYSTLMGEIDAQLREDRLPLPTVAVAPMGVGALGAAMISSLDTMSPRPVIIAAEPTNAACVLESVLAGQAVPVSGPHTTIMAGLSCGVVSSVALPTLLAGLDAAMSFEDEWAVEAMQILATEGIVSGETGAASLGALLALADTRPDLAEQLNLGVDDVALIIVTEGATDPVSYERIVGRDPLVVDGSSG